MSQGGAVKPKPSYARQLAGKAGDVALAVLVQSGTAVVGTGFWVILNTLGTVAYWQRVLDPTPAPIRTIQAAHRRQQQQKGAHGASNGADSKPGADGKLGQRSAVSIRAVATDPDAIVPMHLPADPELGYASEAWKLVGPYLRQHGSSAIANSQLQNPEFQHFFVPGMGSLPYVVADIYHRIVISAIGDPLAPEEHWAALTRLFVKEFPACFFYHASEKYAKVLAELGYWINDVGAETTLQVQSWTYGPKTRTVRAAARSAREAGVRVRELKPEELTEEMRHKLQHEISGDWLQQKAVAERVLRVFVRNVDYDRLQLADGIRIFVAEQHDPATAPPAVVDPVLQGLPANVKPPKPPRNKSGRNLASPGSSSSLSRKDSAAALSRSNSALTPASSASSMPSLLPAGSGPLLEFTASGALADADAAAAAAAGAASPAAGSSGSGGAAAAAAVDPAQPELLGFVLLDPLWEGGSEMGYVSSICRMKRSAHQGTLKLLYEDIISKLRAEGRRELAFGFAPFFNVRDEGPGRYIHWFRWCMLYFYHCCNNLYAFKNLAFSKIRYGAGLTPEGDKFRDANVTLTHVYMGSPSYPPGMNILDLYVLCMYVGFMGPMFDTLLKLVGLRRGGANLDTSGPME